MKFCTNCGSQLPDESIFCTHCGASLNTDAVNTSAESGYAADDERAAEPTVGATVGGYEQAPPQSDYSQQGIPQPQTQAGYPPYQPQSNPQPMGQMPYQQNPYNYAPPQAPVEEKANVGLAILSFFIPLVGLIMFITQKDKKPKTAKACGLAALIGFVLGIIMSIAVSALTAKLVDNGYDEINSIVDDYDIDGIDGIDSLLDDDDDAVIFGSFDDSFYENDYFNIYYTLPYDWRFQTYEEISSDDLEYGFDEETGVPYAEDGSSRIYYDSTAENEETYSKIITGCIAKGGAFTSNEDVLDYFVNTDDEDLTDVTDYYSKSVAGLDFVCCDVTYDDDGFGMYAGYYVTEKNGNYYIIYNFTTDYDENKPVDYLEYFY